MTARAAAWNPTGFAVHLCLGLILVLWMVPEAYMVSIALRSPDQVFNPTLLAWPLTVDNFVTVVRDNPLPRFFLNSLVVTVATVALVLAVSSLFAFAAGILKLPGTTALYAVLLTTLMVPLASLVLPLAILLKTFGWVNRYVGLIFPYVALGAPFAVER